MEDSDRVPCPVGSVDYYKVLHRRLVIMPFDLSFEPPIEIYRGRFPQREPDRMITGHY